MEFALHSSIDIDALARQFSTQGMVSIQPFLEPEQAQALFELLKQRQDWRQVINSGSEKIFEFDRDAQSALTAEQKSALDTAVYAQARNGFQFRYETIRVPDSEAEREKGDDLLFRFATWMSQGDARSAFKAITGDDRITFADAQATAYSPGDFLTSHDDDVAGKNRSAAYVLSLNPEWRIEWGGLFLMHNENGGAAGAVAPGFNKLKLFAVPQMHSVSEVTRAAANRRYSITGWLRH